MKKISRKEKERQQREADMVLSAKKLFVTKGFNSVSMDEIARKAQFTKRTLYQYFTNKEDLFFAVALKGFQELFTYCERGFQKGKTGFEKLQNSLYAYRDFAREHADMFRLMNEVGPIRRQTKNSPKLTEWLALDDQLFHATAGVIALGKEDGSICQDIEPLKGTFSIVFMTTGFFHLWAETGHHFIDHFNLDPDEFITYSLELFFKSIKP